MNVTHNLHVEGEDNVIGTAEIVPMPEGDLLVALRHADAHPDDERAIVKIAATDGGGFTVTVMDGDGCLLAPALTIAPEGESIQDLFRASYPEGVETHPDA